MGREQGWCGGTLEGSTRSSRVQRLQRHAGRRRGSLHRNRHRTHRRGSPRPPRHRHARPAVPVRIRVSIQLKRLVEQGTEGRALCVACLLRGMANPAGGFRVQGCAL